jgi:hypothetical protein
MIPQQGFDGRQDSKAHLHLVQDTPLFFVKEASALLDSAGRAGRVTERTQHSALIYAKFAHVNIYSTITFNQSHVDYG